jgi:hypothetical protein
VLVEVDGKPIGGYRHWVVYIGNGKMIDPWDGKEKSTSSYPSPLSYCVIGGKWNKPSPTPNTEKELEACTSDRNLHWDMLFTIFIELGVPLDSNNKLKSVDMAVKRIQQLKIPIITEVIKEVPIVKEIVNEVVKEVPTEVVKEVEVEKTVVVEPRFLNTFAQFLYGLAKAIEPSRDAEKENPTNEVGTKNTG